MRPRAARKSVWSRAILLSRSCQQLPVRSAGPGSVRQPPTTHAGNAPYAHTRSLPRRLADGDDDIRQAHRCGGVFQQATDHTPGSRRAESLRARSSFAARRRAPTAVGGRSQARHCKGAALPFARHESSPFTQSTNGGQSCRSRSAGLGRPRTLESRSSTSLVRRPTVTTSTA